MLDKHIKVLPTHHITMKPAKMYNSKSLPKAKACIKKNIHLFLIIQRFFLHNYPLTNDGMTIKVYTALSLNAHEEINYEIINTRAIFLGISCVTHLYISGSLLVSIVIFHLGNILSTLRLVAKLI